MGQRFADERDARRGGSIVLVERSAAPQRNSHNPEILRTYSGVIGRASGSGGKRQAADNVEGQVALPLTIQGQRSRHRRIVQAWLSLDPSQQFVRKVGPLLRC